MAFMRFNQHLEFFARLAERLGQLVSLFNPTISNPEKPRKSLQFQAKFLIWPL
jgi:hypothetical protein